MTKSILYLCSLCSKKGLYSQELCAGKMEKVSPIHPIRKGVVEDEHRESEIFVTGLSMMKADSNRFEGVLLP